MFIEVCMGEEEAEEMCRYYDDKIGFLNINYDKSQYGYQLQISCEDPIKYSSYKASSSAYALSASALILLSSITALN